MTKKLNYTCPYNMFEKLSFMHVYRKKVTIRDNEQKHNIKTFKNIIKLIFNRKQCKTTFLNVLA